MLPSKLAEKPDSFNNLAVIILAAGAGKRMKSPLPKVLQPIGGVAMLGHVIATASKLIPKSMTVVYGHQGDEVRAAFANDSLTWALQAKQLGTGDAVRQALPFCAPDGVALILYGDIPLITEQTIRLLAVEATAKNALVWLTQNVQNPTGLGRIIRDEAGNLLEIKNERDATAKQKQINEIWTGLLACPVQKLNEWLPKLGKGNAEEEYYLTDIMAFAVAENTMQSSCHPIYAWECAGVNDQVERARAERQYQFNAANALMLNEGVILADPARFDLRGTLKCAPNVTIDINCIFEGAVELGDNVKVGANCVLKDCSIAAGTQLHPFTMIDGAEIGVNCKIGPYARIRPNTTLAQDVHIGNFVELKAAKVAAGSKANHLSYLGDTVIGSGVNIGAGTITCNYDGANKYQTIIEDNVFVGSDVQLVAPVRVAAGATVAAGTTVWRDIENSGLTLNPKTQTAKNDWQRPLKK
jgi:bifunctional UDP-N-acetylglucosamine pyrophosphorylase / glucosamine-1-phosphate N-acetyltransferase